MVMVGPGEQDRYLAPFLDHLLDFCDEVRVRCEDTEILFDPALAVEVMYAKPSFFNHEGNARQQLLEHAMRGLPTHLLAIDADEFVGDGQKLRAAMEAGGQNGVWKLEMTEVWGADKDALHVRMDGKWPPRPIGIAFEVPQDHHVNRQKRRHWRLPPSAAASGRVPILTQAASNRTSVPPTTSVLHFGWACKADRVARHARYANAEGFGHDNRHIASIMFSDAQVQTKPIPWPPSLDKKTLLARVNRK
jgi:hypothetical protein